VVWTGQTVYLKFLLGNYLALFALSLYSPFYALLKTQLIENYQKRRNFKMFLNHFI